MRINFSVFFDNGLDAYVSIMDVHLMLDQPLDPETKQFDPKKAYAHIFQNPQRAEFVRLVFL